MEDCKIIIQEIESTVRISFNSLQSILFSVFMCCVAAKFILKLTKEKFVKKCLTVDLLREVVNSERPTLKPTCFSYIQIINFLFAGVRSITYLISPGI